MQIVNQSLLTHYERHGKGKKVIILPGWNDTTLGWGAIQHQLAGLYDVIVLDLPGFGETQAPSSVWCLDDYFRF